MKRYAVSYSGKVDMENAALGVYTRTTIVFKTLEQANNWIRLNIGVPMNSHDVRAKEIEVEDINRGVKFYYE